MGDSCAERQNDSLSSRVGCRAELCAVIHTGEGVNEKGRGNSTNKIRNDILANRASPGWEKTQRTHLVLFSALPEDELWAETSPLI